MGVALTRLIPRRWLLVGVALMWFVDVLLLAAGIGQPAAALMEHATARLHGPAFDSATVGPGTVDYPDLVLAAVLGGFVAGYASQRRAALTLTLLAAAFGMLLAVIDTLPATVPIALTLVLVTRRCHGDEDDQPPRDLPLVGSWGLQGTGGVDGCALRRHQLAWQERSSECRSQPWLSTAEPPRRSSARV